MIMLKCREGHTSKIQIIIGIYVQISISATYDTLEAGNAF